MLVSIWVRFLEHCERNETQHMYYKVIYNSKEAHIICFILFFNFNFTYVIFSAHRIGIYIKILIDILFFVYFCTNCYLTIDTYLEFISF